MAKTFWDKGKATYRDAKGKEIPYGNVRQAVDAVADDAKGKIRSLTTLFNDGKLTIPEWATQTDEIIRKSLIASGQIAAGGREQMDNVLNGRLGSRVRFHLDAHRRFAIALENGDVTAAQALARGDLYGDAVVRVYEEIRKTVSLDAGYTKATNILNDGAAHCSQCPSLGTLPIADMPPPGTRVCMNHCRCTVIYF